MANPFDSSADIRADEPMGNAWELANNASGSGSTSFVPLVAEVAKDAGGAKPYRLHLGSVRGLNAAMGRQHDVKYDGPGEHKVYVSLYHFASMKIFGRTFVSSSKEWPDAEGGQLSVELAHDIFYSTAIDDSNVCAVVELVRVSDEVDSVDGSNELGMEVGVGWGLLQLFGIAGVSESSAVVELPLYPGTPRYLLFNNDTPVSKALPGVFLQYSVNTHEALAPFASLMHEEVMVGDGADAVPGLQDGPKAPKPSNCSDVTLSSIEVACPPERLQTLQDTMNANVVFPKFLNSQGIAGYRMLVGAHNGASYVSPLTAVALEFDGAKNVLNTKYGSSVVIEGVPCDAKIALVAEVEILWDTQVTEDGVTGSGAPTPMLLGWFTMVPFAKDLGSSFEHSKEKGAHTWSGDDLVCTGQLKTGPEASPDGRLGMRQIYTDSSFGNPPQPCDMFTTVLLAVSRAVPGAPFVMPAMKVAEHVAPVPVAAPAPAPAAAVEGAAAPAVVFVPGGSAIAQATGGAPSAQSQALLQQKNDTIQRLQAQLANMKHDNASAAAPDTEGMSAKQAAAAHEKAYKAMQGKVSSAELEISALKQENEETRTALHTIEAEKSKLAHEKARIATDMRRSMEQIEEQKASSLALKKRLATTGGVAPPEIEQLRREMQADMEVEMVEGINSKTVLMGAAEREVPRKLRAEFAKSGVPELVGSRNGGAAPPPGHGGSVDLVAEGSDALQGNDITFQLMGLAPPDGPAGAALQRVFFSMQLYHFPPVITPAVELSPMEQGQNGYVLQKAGSEEKGLMLNFVIPGEITAHSLNSESRKLAGYMQSARMSIEVWDADSLLPIGTAEMWLAALCRQGRPSIELTRELDVRSPLLPGGSGGETRHFLQLRAINVGRLADPVGTGAALMTSRMAAHNVYSGRTVEIQPAKATGVRTRQRVRAKKLGTSDLSGGAAAAALPSKASATEEELLKIRQAARLAARGNKENSRSRGRDAARMEKMDADRAASEGQMKRATINQLLKDTITRTLRLPVSFGEASFFEFVFQNPFSSNLTFDISWDDEELEIVTDEEEWLFYKRLHGLKTPCESGMMTRTNQIYLTANEAVYIPFVYRSFKSGPVATVKPSGDVSARGTSTVGKVSAKQAVIEEKSVEIKVCSIPQGNTTQEARLAAVLHVEVQPKPYVVDARLHFYQREHDKARQLIPSQSHMLPPWRQSAAAPTGSGWGVHCPNEDALVQLDGGAAGVDGITDDALPDVKLTYAMPDAPSATILPIVVYKDRFKAVPAGIWEVVLHSLSTAPLGDAVVGQVARGSLMLRNKGDKDRTVRCYSSDTKALALQPSGDISLPMGEMSELYTKLRTLNKGRSAALVSMVDVQQGEMLSSWLVSADARSVAVSRTYESPSLPANAEKRMKIKYTNLYSHAKTYLLSTDRPDVLRLNTASLSLQPGASEFIGFYISPMAAGTSLQLHVFINDENEKNEETVMIAAGWKAETH